MKSKAVVEEAEDLSVLKVAAMNCNFSDDELEFSTNKITGKITLMKCNLAMTETITVWFGLE